MLRADRGSRSNARRCDRCGRRPKTLIGAVLCAVLAMTNCWFFCCRLPSSNRHVQIKPVRVTSEWRQG